MRVILTGGGTGGHVYPAIAIAEKIKEKYPGSEILFVGTERGMERKIVPSNGYEIRFITISGFDRKHMLKNAKTAVNLVKGSMQSRTILKEFRPDVVIGTGGYVCAPVVRMAAKMGILTFIHEQNAYPGMTNKMLEKYVDKVFLAFAEAAKYFKKKDKLVVTGNPVRKAFREAKRETARTLLSIPQDAFVVLAFGGSLGAKRINEAALPLLEFTAGQKDLYTVLATGSYYYREMTEKAQAKHLDLADNIRVLEYIDDMPSYLAAADLVISRAGALTISEIVAGGKPAILIPSPNVTGNHQFYNAKSIAGRGGAVLIEEPDLTDESLISSVLSLMNDRQRLGDMAKASRAAASEDALGKIVAYL